ncbi:MAG: stage III sporulation protein AF [Clostridiaceae bacterium]|jgi:stage III sporulation protein AF|nr:stage III sporulation protein AF [Clostridiaceae bacterium]
MGEIRSWVLNIAAVAVLMVILELLMPEGRIRKFTQLLSGFIIMFVMINPIMSLFGKGVNESWAGLKDEAFLWNRQIRNMSESMREEQSRQTLELYRKMILSDIKNRLKSYKQIKDAEVDMVLNENIRSEKFGEIRKLYLNLSFRDNAGQHMSVVREIRKELTEIFLLPESEIIIHVSEEK